MKFKEYISEAKLEPLFTSVTVKAEAAKIQKEIKAPHVQASISTLGGEINVSILMLISLDEKKDWPNGIIENSRYMRFHLIAKDHELEQFIKGRDISKKFRKARPKTVEDAIKKINTYIGQVK